MVVRPAAVIGVICMLAAGAASAAPDGLAAAPAPAPAPSAPAPSAPAPAAPAPAAPAAPDAEVLALVNHYRAQAGVAPVVIDPALSKGCMEHASYMLQNRGTPAMDGLAAHHQDPKRPGATPAGAACGVAADLFPGVSDLGTAVDGWMAGLYHRRPILAPSLRTIGVGYAPLPDGTLMAALMFVDAGGAQRDGWPVAYPAVDQRDVPLELGNEIPDPSPGGSGGYPLTLQFPPFDKVTGASATLTDAAGAPVAAYVSTPEQPATSFGQYGVICVIPKQALRPNTRYTVAMTATWGAAPAHTWSWSFTTVALRRVDANDEAGLLAALGHPSLVHGVVQYGGMMDTQTVFLTIARSDHGRYQMVSIVIPLAVWKSVAGAANPATYTGATVDVETTPTLAMNAYLNLPITLATQLHVTR